MHIKKNYIKVIVIGESGSGKSTMIRHLAQNPEQLRSISSQTGSAGTTKCSVEYIFGDFPCITVESLNYNIKVMRGTSKYRQFIKETETQIIQDTEIDTIEPSSDVSDCILESIINKKLLAKYKQKSIESILSDINTPNLLYSITINVPATSNLLTCIQTNNIQSLHVVDTRGVGDSDYNIIKNDTSDIPIENTDALIFVTKMDIASPAITKGLQALANKYYYIPRIFIGRHTFDEDSIYIPNVETFTTEDYLLLLDEYTKHKDTYLYIDYMKNISHDLETFKQQKLNGCIANYLPHLKTMLLTSKSKYYKFYAPACIHIFKNCIITIKKYQELEDAFIDYIRRTKDTFSNKQNERFLIKDKLHIVMKKIKELPNTYPRLMVVPNSSNLYRDFKYIKESPYCSDKRYYWECAGTDVLRIFNYYIRIAIESENTELNQMLAFVLHRKLNHITYTRYMYNTTYLYLSIYFLQKLIKCCHEHCEILSAIYNRPYNINNISFLLEGNIYHKEEAFIILLIENTLRYLLRDINIDLNYDDTAPILK